MIVVQLSQPPLDSSYEQIVKSRSLEPRLGFASYPAGGLRGVSWSRMSGSLRVYIVIDGHFMAKFGSVVSQGHLSRFSSFIFY